MKIVTVPMTDADHAELMLLVDVYAHHVQAGPNLRAIGLTDEDMRVAGIVGMMVRKFSAMSVEQVAELVPDHVPEEWTDL